MGLNAGGVNPPTEQPAPSCDVRAAGGEQEVRSSAGDEVPVCSSPSSLHLVFT